MKTGKEERPLCPYCISPLVGRLGNCPECGTPHHVECWEGHGRCTTFGCSATELASIRVVQPGELPAVFPTAPTPPPSPPNGGAGFACGIALGSGVAVIVVLGCLGSMLLPRIFRPPNPESTRMPVETSTFTPVVATVSPTPAPRTPRTPTPTPRPPTRTPAPTRAPTATPTRVSVISCSLRVGDTFRPLWTDSIRNRIGCPVDREHGLITSYTTFERGFMIYRSDRPNLAYVFYQGHTWVQYSSPWREGIPDYSCPDQNTPSASPPTPRRGFGYVWCNEPGVRSRLGWATADELGDYRNVQNFQHGWMLQRYPREGEPRYVIFEDGTWEQR